MMAALLRFQTTGNRRETQSPPFRFASPDHLESAEDPLVGYAAFADAARDRWHLRRMSKIRPGVPDEKAGA